MSFRVPLRYAGWMARDAAVRPGLAVVAFAVLFAFFATRLPGPLSATFAKDFLTRTIGQTDWLIVLIATTGMVSWDRTSGYYRTLFSHPVDPGLYYLQRWVVAGLAAALVIPLVGLGLLVVSGSFPWSGSLLVRFLIKYLLLGGLTFALSTVVRADWAIAFTVSMLQSILYGLEKAGAPLSAFTKWLAHVLPPFHLGSTATMSPAALGVPTSAYPTGAELLHALSYGVGILGVAMAVLRFRPLGSGGRV